MANLNYLLLAVKDPLGSAALYDQLFGVAPVERAKTFVLYVLPGGLKVGLWAAADMKPAPKPPGGVELSFSLPDEASVRQTYTAWTKLGLEVVQEPTHLDFGFTCVVADPDGHRLRPFVLADNPR
jgi:predicted enzyme related to lactoylglutathione lyase